MVGARQMKFATMMEAVVDRHFVEWWRYAMFRAGRHQDADDVVQDAIWRTLRARPGLESEQAASRYVWTVIRNTSVHRVRRLTTGVRTARLAVVRSGETLSQLERSPLEILLDIEDSEERRRTIEAIMAELMQLPQELREAVELYLLREPSLLLREVAEIQDVAISTVHSRIDKAIKILADVIVEKQRPA